MKRILLILFFLVSAVSAIAQDDYDVYTPKVYAPLQYSPKATFRFTPRPFSATSVAATVQNLKTFIEKTKAYPELKTEYRGDWNDYVTLAAKYLAKGKPMEYIGNRKQMKYFPEDWAFLDRHIYDSELTAKKQKEKKSVRDSIAFRTSFVRDSTLARESFVKDSLLARRRFETDSLYRANFRKVNHYDYVLFDGPHGNPKLCYRKGKIIDGKIYNEAGLLEKEYKGGRLVHDYEYSDWYVKSIQNSSFDRDRILKNYSDFYCDDKILRRKSYYVSGEAVRERRVDREEYYNANGVVTKEVQYGGLTDDGIDYEVVFLSYFPDNKTVKTQQVTYHEEYDIRRMGNVAIMEFFSDGNRKQTKKYRKVNSGKLIIKEIWTYKDGYANVEYYDFDGNLERRTTETL